MVKCNATECLRAMLERIAGDKEGYRLDYEMSSDTVGRHIQLLTGLADSREAVSGMLNEKELSAMMKVAESIYPRNFYSGTGYGTCYGARQLTDIVCNVLGQYENLGTESLRTAYIVTLHELYSIRSHYSVIPLRSYLEGESDGLFPVHTIPYLNEQLAAAKTPKRKREIMNEIVAEARGQLG